MKHVPAALDSHLMCQESGCLTRPARVAGAGSRRSISTGSILISSLISRASSSLGPGHQLPVVMLALATDGRSRSRAPRPRPARRKVRVARSCATCWRGNVCGATHAKAAAPAPAAAKRHQTASSFKPRHASISPRSLSAPSSSLPCRLFYMFVDPRIT